MVTDVLLIAHFPPPFLYADVIQHVLKHGKPKDRDVLMEGVQKNLLTYSQHKFASNVVEKCLEFGTVEERGFLINHVFTENVHGMREGQKNLLQTMVCDPYANYVVQKMLDVATPEQRGAIITEIRAHSTQVSERVIDSYEEQSKPCPNGLLC